MIELLAYLLMLLAQQSTVDAVPPSIVQAASVVAGEAPISLVGIDGHLNTLCTVRNRLDSPRYPNTLDGVMAAYYAPPRTPTADELAFAAAILTTPGACAPETPGAFSQIYYVMSQQDIEAHGWPEGDSIAGDGIFRLHFYATHPGATP